MRLSLPSNFLARPSFSAGLFLLGLIALLVGCAGQKYPPYSPHENVLSIAAEFELLAARDPYEDGPAEELTGQNIARATLVRLANYQSLHPERFTPEVAVLKARAYEWLGDLESARANYADAAEFDTELRDECLRRIDVLDELIATSRLALPGASLEQYILDLRTQAKAYADYATQTEDPFAAALARRAAEQAEVDRAELLASNRWILPDGENQALEALNDLVNDHRRSCRALEHALRLARFHRSLAEEELRLHPPTTLGFDADRFAENLNRARDILYRVSQADGRPERLLASHELDTVIALGELTAAQAD